MISKFPLFANLSKSHVSFFQSILSPNELIYDDASQLNKFNKDFYGKFIGESKLVLLPSKSVQISSILSYCNEKKLPIALQGGNTGSIGSSTPVFDELILSLRNMNKIYQFDTHNEVLSCEAGCLSRDLDNYLKDFGYEFPLKLNSKDSMIGGNIATNAEGKYFRIHGELRENLRSLEVVLADGTILNMDLMKSKNIPGFGINNLFLGSQGTLGVITKCEILCKKISKKKKLVIFICENFDQVLSLYQLGNNHLGFNLSAFDFIDPNSFQLLWEEISSSIKLSSSDGNQNSYMVIMEIASIQENIEAIQDYFCKFLETAGILKKNIFSKNEEEIEDFWTIRGKLNEAYKNVGFVKSYSLNLKSYEILKILKEKTNGWGIIAYNGNLKNENFYVQTISKKKETNELLKDIIKPFLLKGLRDRNESIRIDFEKDYDSNSQKIQDYMAKIKKMFDPNGILNPYKIFHLDE